MEGRIHHEELEKAMARITPLLPLLALLFSVLAYAWPEAFAGAKPMIVPLLGVVMLGMGMTLTWDNFREVLLASFWSRRGLVEADMPGKNS